MNFSQARSNIILIIKTYSLYLIRNILSNIKSCVLKRINFLFRINQKKLNSLIRRIAHIMLLEKQDLI